MKIRSSFVTNSSSSSFVVSAKREKKKEMSDFYDIVNCMEGYETGTPVLVSSEKDLKNYVEREYSRTLPDLMESDEYYKERYGNILKELRDGNTTKKNIQAAYKAAKSNVAQYKAIIEKTKKEVEKETKKSIKDSDANYTFSNLTKGCNTCMTILSILQREQVKACNIYHKNCRKVANRALRGVGTTEESYNFGSSYGNLTNEFSFIR